MGFCGGCGKKADEIDKFCTSCGAKIKLPTQIPVHIVEYSEETLVEEPPQKTITHDDEIPQPRIEDSTFLAKNFDDLGTTFEKVVETIFQNRGYHTETPFITRGRSATEYNIDVFAEKGDETIVVECHKSDSDKKIGIKEIKEFSAALEDLNFSKGVFVASTGFSSSVIGWTTNNPSLKHIELWDTAKVMAEYFSSEKQKVDGKKIILENCLPPKKTLENYTVLLLANKQRIATKRCEIVFVPYHLVSFHLHEEFHTPDGNVHTQHNEGRYIVDGVSNQMLARSDSKTNIVYNLNDEQKQVIKDLQMIDPQRNFEFVPESNWKASRLESNKSEKETEFMMKQKIINDNVHEVKYLVNLANNKSEKRKFIHTPNLNSISLNSTLIYVPRVEIEFDSREYSYSRRLLPASDVYISDEISYCKHPIGRKHTIAVCDVCGIAKCESHILKSPGGAYYCKKHSPEKAGNEKSSGFKKIGFPFKRK